ncbi:cyclopropane-fatty-acyl-phospholipid synthase family protein [Halioxenophilus aromaticivorans]|uniref:Cyclopropane-fatty-acyl-phospholipid synthase family protein n=1 Tax=Halioxenophilus aromaticivorans TaxID=1306992 RepID=A0AAV3TYV1_9ALTE
MKAISIDETKPASRQTHRRWLDNMAKDLIFDLFKQLTVGRLTISEGNETYTFGQDAQLAEVNAHIVVHQPWAYRQVLFNGSIGSGEAYMQRGWSSPDLLQVIRIFVRNQKTLVKMDNRVTKLKGIFCWAFHKMNSNTVSGSQNNIAAHYDLSNEFFGLFLDPWRMYSAAVFDTPGCTLEQASVKKLDQVCRALKLSESDHLLEIGTGWGGLAIYAAKRFGCRVTTTTISQQQYEYAKDWVAKEGLNEKITLLKQDYRLLEGEFDKLVSIEMIEAVGHEYYATFFNKCSDLLKPDGLMLLQSITIADQNYYQAKKSVDFIQRYIFPGGALPSVEVLAKNVRKHTDMQIVSLTDITEDYAKTLAIWRERFWANIDRVRSMGFDGVFERMWEFYLAYCEGGFKERAIGTVQVLVAKPDARNLPHFIG